MKNVSRPIFLLAVFFVFGASLAEANNFSKSKKAAEVVEPAAAQAEPVALTASAVVETTAPAEAKINAVVEEAALSVPETKPQPVEARKPEPAAKPAPPAKTESSKPDPTKPYEIMTFDRTLIVCQDGYACQEKGEGDYKCVPDKSASEGGHGGICKTILRPQEPAQKTAAATERKK